MAKIEGRRSLVRKGMAGDRSPSFRDIASGDAPGETSNAGTPSPTLHRIADARHVGHPIGVLDSEIRGQNLGEHRDLRHEIK